MKLYDHQQAIVDADPKKCGLFLGTGSAKTRMALELAQGSILVVAPKTQVEDKNWERENKKWNINKNITTITFDIFKRDVAKLPYFDTLIVDEAHGMLGVTPNTRQRKRITIPRASQRFEALDWYVGWYKPKRIYLCTATIVKSPMTVWGAGKILGKLNENTMESFLYFRDKYYTKLPMPGREVYVAKRDSNTKDELAKVVRKLGYVGRLEDYFDVPEQTYRTVYINLTEKQKLRIKALPLEFPDPIVLLGKRLQVENGVLAGDEFNEAEEFPNEKVEKILESAEEFPRMIVFAKYTAQIHQIDQALTGAGIYTWVLDGKTKDREGVIKQAGELDGVLIVQAQISAGWEVPQTPVMIFASRTYSYVDYQQALGRIQRANHIKKNLYINLVVKGGVDEAVDNALANKQSFDERLYLGI